jgi:protein-S-isoprenylcysteine O-methyltransferase Ste14
MQWLEHKIPPPLFGLLCAIGMWWSSSGLQWEAVGTLRYSLAGLVLVVGLGFDALGLLAFRRARTTVNPLRPGKASALVATGVYRITRNPMYVGMALLLCGWAAMLGSLAALAGPLVFVLFITRFQIVPEERVLSAKFGEDYTRFCQQVRRWL